MHVHLCPPQRGWHGLWPTPCLFEGLDAMGRVAFKPAIACLEGKTVTSIGICFVKPTPAASFQMQDAGRVGDA